MGLTARQILIDTGLWYPLNLLRRTPDMLRWAAKGFEGVPPHAVKMLTLERYLRRFGLRHFIETGTYLGETLGFIARTGVECTSIELSPELYRAAAARFKGQANVRLLQGDSARKLPEVVAGLQAPALFWLDGHYSAGVTARGDKSSPVFDELEAIFNHPVRRHVILIDDASYFDGSADVPALEDILRFVRGQKDYRAGVSADIIRLTPASVDSVE